MTKNKLREEYGGEAKAANSSSGTSRGRAATPKTPGTAGRKRGVGGKGKAKREVFNVAEDDANDSVVEEGSSRKRARNGEGDGEVNGTGIKASPQEEEDAECSDDDGEMFQ